MGEFKILGGGGGGEVPPLKFSLGKNTLFVGEKPAVVSSTTVPISGTSICESSVEIDRYFVPLYFLTTIPWNL